LYGCYGKTDDEEKECAGRHPEDIREPVDFEVYAGKVEAEQQDGDNSVKGYLRKPSQDLNAQSQSPPGRMLQLAGLHEFDRKKKNKRNPDVILYEREVTRIDMRR